MSSDHVLDAIDGCLADYAMSVDAMRWNPDVADEDLDLPPCQNVSLAGAVRVGIDPSPREPGSWVVIARGSDVAQLDLVAVIQSEVWQAYARQIGEAFAGLGEAAKRAARALQGILPELRTDLAPPPGQVYVPDRPIPLPRFHAGPITVPRAPRTLGTVRTAAASRPFPRRRA